MELAHLDTKNSVSISQGHLAQMFSISSKTIDRYVKAGLLPKPIRTGSGNRAGCRNYFPVGAIEILNTINKNKPSHSISPSGSGWNRYPHINRIWMYPNGIMYNPKEVDGSKSYFKSGVTMKLKEIIEVLNAEDIEISERTLSRWAVQGLIPKPEPKSLGQGKGSESIWPDETLFEAYASYQLMKYGLKAEAVARVRQVALAEEKNDPMKLLSGPDKHLKLSWIEEKEEAQSRLNDKQAIHILYTVSSSGIKKEVKIIDYEDE